MDFCRRFSPQLQDAVALTNLTGSFRPVAIIFGHHVCWRFLKELIPMKGHVAEFFSVVSSCLKDVIRACRSCHHWLSKQSVKTRNWLNWIINLCICIKPEQILKAIFRQIVKLPSLLQPYAVAQKISQPRRQGATEGAATVRAGGETTSRMDVYFAMSS